MTRVQTVVLLSLTGALAACSGGSSDSPPSPRVAAAAPVFSPDPGFAFGAPLDVTIATSTAGATIRYTLDGTDPTAASSVYAEPITLTTTTELRAAATRAGIDPSAVTSRRYTWKPVNLQLGDGTWDRDGGSAAGWGDRHLYVNRFTVGASALPFSLRTVSILFEGTPAAGTTYDLVVYSDVDADPGNGATLEAIFAVTSTYADATRWSTYALPDPVLVTTDTELFIGFLARDSLSNAVCDDSTTGRSGILQWGSAPMPALPVLPDAGAAYFPNTVCTYMIRGSN